MRDFWVILVIFILVFAGGKLANNYIEKTANELLEYIVQMSDSFDKTRKDKELVVKKLQEKWEDTEKKWIVFEYHDSINEIEDLLIECYTYFIKGSEEEYMVSFGKLKRHIDDMQNRGTLTYVNIF